MFFEDLGRIRYKKAWDYQEKLFDELVDAKSSDVGKERQYLLFCEHDPVYTLGKHGNRDNLLVAEHVCRSRRIDLHAIDRGGDITFHGPGQLVVYPIFDLESFGMGIKSYISALEDVVIEVLGFYGINGEKDDKAMGVWLEPFTPERARKICAIGVRASRFVTMHGLALNVNTDLAYFNYINPCGFRDRGVTSLQRELSHEVPFGEVAERMKRVFASRFGIEFEDLNIFNP